MVNLQHILFLQNVDQLPPIPTILLKREEMPSVIWSISIRLMLQVAFGFDVSRPWSDEELGLKHIEGDETLGFLLEHSFEGVETMARNPFYYVRK